MVRSIAGALAALLLAGAVQAADKPAAWQVGGGNVLNTRSADGETAIGVGTVGSLQPLWSVTLKGAVSAATPVSDGKSLYLPTSLGHVTRVDRVTGKVDWDVALDDVTGIVGAGSKASLGLSGEAIILGLQNAPVVVALSKQDGRLLWQTRIDDNPTVYSIQAPLVTEGRVFIGTANATEEGGTLYDNPTCCTFRGQVAALDAATGKLLWRFHPLPEGFAGGAVWGSTPIYDAKRKSLYITTGNGFWAPKEVQACADANRHDPARLRACYPKNTWFDSIVALDVATGRLKWGFRAEDYDFFTGVCLYAKDERKNPYCGNGPDHDFGQGAMLWRAGNRDLVGAGQKSGEFWALDADTGVLVWTAKLGPGGASGGILGGSATDGERLYVAEANTKQIGRGPVSYTLPSGESINYGSYAALDPATGRILWQIADPSGQEYPVTDKPCTLEAAVANANNQSAGTQAKPSDCRGAYASGPVTVANGVLFACSTAPPGPLYGFDAASGKLLWTFDTGSGCRSGASVMDGVVYWATGRTLRAFAPKRGS